jgi:hypothetical protein
MGMFKHLLTLLALVSVSSTLASSLSVSTGIGDALVNLNGGLGFLALEGEYDLSNTFSLNLGLGYAGGIYAAGGAQYHFDDTASGPFLGARANYFEGAGLSGYGLHLLGGFRTGFPAPRDERDARENGRGLYDVMLGFSPYYQNSSIPELTGWRLGFSLGARIGFHFPKP